MRTIFHSTRGSVRTRISRAIPAAILSILLAVLAMAQALVPVPVWADLPPEFMARLENPALPRSSSPPADTAGKAGQADALVRASGDTSSSDFHAAVFSSGVYAYFAGDYRLAAMTLARSRESFPLMADWASYYLGLSLLKEGEVSAAAAELERVAETAGGSVAAQDSLVVAGMCREYLGESGRAFFHYERWLTDPEPGLTPQILYRAATVAAALGMDAKATEWLRELSVTHAASPWSDRGDVLAQSLASAGRSEFRPFAPDSLFAKAKVLIEADRPDLVLALLDFCQSLYPGEEQAGILYYRAKAHAARKENAKAAALFRESAERYPQSDFAPWALYHSIRSALKQFGEDDPSRAELAYGEVQAKYPDVTGVAGVIRKGLIHGYIETARYREALRLAETQDRLSLTDEASEYAAWMKGLLLYSQNEPAAARTAFDSFAARFPVSENAAGAIYWSGRASLALGDKERAAAAFGRNIVERPNTYYGIKSQEMQALARPQAGSWLRIPVTGGTAEMPCPGEFDLPDLISAGPLAPALDRVRVLEAIRLTDLAERELGRLSARNPGNAALAYRHARLLAGKGNVVAAMRVLRRTFEGCLLRGSPEQLRPFRDILYPRRHEDAIARCLAGTGTDPDLIFALIRQESFFREDAVSPVGALGLMQVMPATGRTIAKALGDKKFTPSRLLDPDTNIRYGIHYFNQRLRQFDRNVVHTLCSYNAGEARIKRWIEVHGLLDPDLFVEFIPFKETREYVKRIMTNLVMYKKSYAQQTRVGE